MSISHSAPRRLRRGAFTVIELLVAVGIASLLMSLLLPAIQNARESARATDCKSRLRQLGSACTAFESSYGRLPSFGQFDRTGSSVGRLAGHVELLPFVEQQTVFAMIDRSEDGVGVMTSPPSSAANSKVMSVSIPLFRCPSDTVRDGGNSYRGCMGPTPSRGTSLPSVPTTLASRRGVFNQGEIRPAHVRDGLSNTVFFSERPVGDGDPQLFSPNRDAFRFRGTINRDQRVILSETMRACESLSSRLPEHYSFAGYTWLVADLSQTQYNHVVTPNSPIPDCYVSAGVAGIGEGSLAARSMHPQRVHVVFGDGAARAITDSIDLEVWRALGSYGAAEIQAPPL